MSDIKDSIRALADKLRADMTITETGAVETPTDLFEKTLPEGITMDQVKSMQDHQSELVTAAGLALGEMGMEAFKGDKRLDQVNVSITAGKDSIAGTFQRSKEVRAGINPDDGMMTKYGILSMKVSVNAHANKGSLKKVRTYLSEQAKLMLEG